MCHVDHVLARQLQPGLDIENDVEIEVADGRLTVSGSRQEKSETTSEDSKVLVRELRFGSFRREFALPEGVTADDVEAHYDKGILEIRVRNVTKPAVEPKKVSIKNLETPVIEGSVE